MWRRTSRIRRAEEEERKEEEKKDEKWEGEEMEEKRRRCRKIWKRRGGISRYRILKSSKKMLNGKNSLLKSCIGSPF